MISRFRSGRAVRYRLAHHVAILVYHRVATLDADPWQIGVRPQHFAQHMAVLRQHYRPAPLAQVAGQIRQGRVTPRSVVVTFDDGYLDNFEQAKPLLEHADVPATFFITTGRLAQSEAFWWDELEHLVLAPEQRPAELCLTIDGVVHRWNLGQAATYTADTARRYRDWVAWKPAPAPRQALFAELWHRLLPLSHQQRHEIMAELRRWAGSAGERRASQQTMSPTQVACLANHPLIEIGAHTQTHQMLASLPLDEQRSEIVACKVTLEQLVEKPVVSFAYPFGKAHHYTPQTVDLLRAAGFQQACTNYTAPVRWGIDLLQLPRIHVPDIDGEAFARMLAVRVP